MILSSFRIQKRCRKLFRLLFILGFLFSPVFSATQTTQAQTFEEDLTAAAKTMFLKEDPTLDPSLVFVSDLLFDPPWGFGIVGTLANDFSEEPSITTFLGKEVNGVWQVALEGSEEYQQWIQEAPDLLVGADRKALYWEQGVLLGNGANQFSLPWAVGQSWTLTGGPHLNDSSKPSEPWSALDFQGPNRSGQARAVRDGVVTISSTCKNFVLITHPDGIKTGYYHLLNIPVTNGARVSRGAVLGDISTAVGCGGSASGPHVHFTLRNSSNQKIAVNGIDFGGWTAVNGSKPYNGCLVRVRDGYRVCQWGTIYNDGTIGTGSIPSCPANTTNTAYVCTPSLSPAYNNNSCSSYWYSISGFNGLPAFLTENAASSSTSSNSGRWTPNLPQSGRYLVEAYIPQHGSFNYACSWGNATIGSDSSRAQYHVFHKGIDTLVVRDQTQYKNQWLSLGEYDFDAGTGGYITLSDLTGETRLSRNPSFSAMRFTFIQPPNPIPSIVSLDPKSTYSRSQPFGLTVFGNNFTEKAVVRLNGIDLPTTWVSKSQLVAAIDEEYLSQIGTAHITVINPSPGGGVSNMAPLPINAVLFLPGVRK